MNPRILHLKWCRTPNYRLKGEVSITLRSQLCSTHYMQHFEPELFEKHLCNPRIPKERNGATRPSYINYRLKSKVSIMLLCRLCSTRCTAVRIKNCLKSTSAIKIATMKNTDAFHYEEKSLRATAKIDIRCQQR